jgi:Uma2 family endonuclease
MAISVPPFPIARFSVEQYHRMVRSGAFTEDDQLELIDGWVVKKTAKGPGHEFTTGELAARFETQAPAGAHVRNQAPITLDGSEPEPDLAVVRGSRSAYRDRHPGAADVLLVVEVSDTTLATDRLKARTYARAGIPEYWIVNLSERCVEVHREPSAESGSYARCDVVTERHSLALPDAGGGAEPIVVSDVLP